MPRAAQLLPIPRRFFRQGVRRYGFHGLSYTYLNQEMHRVGEPALQNGRMVYAHLGNGASVAAILNGRSVDTSMAFTPTAGMVMGSRSGDLDPGVLAYLARTESMSTERFQRMINHESGLLGVSESSSDMRELLALESVDERAADAVEIFCASARKWIASMAASLDGLDVLTFTGGIGENAATVRERICKGLGFLGVGIDNARNRLNAAIISPDLADVRVRVVPTDEESVLTDEAIRVMTDPQAAEC
jgi:acetate kinase